jgi:ABC-2 type transport system ATP-binding protein
MTPMVNVRGLAKAFRRPDGTELFAVHDVHFTIARGEIYSLLGPNGAGKTTTISMISGLLRPTRGDAEIGGFSITRQAMDAKKLMSVVPQEIALYPTLTARQNLEFFGRIFGLSGSELKKRVDEVLAFTDLAERADEKIEKFSGGMKRRVNIGVGLLNRPQLIYMDEPTVGIDPQNRRRVLDTVLRLRDEMQMTVLYTSHLMEEVQEISDRVAIMDHGKIIAEGTVGELIQTVGEEDRLVFNVGGQQIDAALLARMQADVPGISRASFVPADGEHAKDGQITIYARRGRSALPPLITLANEAGVELFSVEVREPDLEAVFLHMTGRALRD